MAGSVFGRCGRVVERLHRNPTGLRVYKGVIIRVRRLRVHCSSGQCHIPISWRTIYIACILFRMINRVKYTQTSLAQTTWAHTYIYSDGPQRQRHKSLDKLNNLLTPTTIDSQKLLRHACIQSLQCTLSPDDAIRPACPSLLRQ